MVKRAKLRKITAGLLAFMLVTSALPVVDILPIDSGVSFGITASAADGNVVASGYCGKNGGQNVKWELTENGTLPDGATAYKLTITGSGEMAGYDFFNKSPWNSYEQYITSVNIADGVTSIGGDAFFNFSSLESVTIPNSVTSIGGSAFYCCSSLTSVTIPDRVKSIGESAFDGCSKLESVTIPCSVTSIGSYVFYYCPDTLKYHLVKGSHADKNISTNKVKVYDQYHSFIGTDGNANTTDEKCLCGEVYNINFSGLDSEVQVTNPVYDGTAQTPTITIDGLIASTDGTTGDYIIEPITPETNAGEYTARITGINNYAGTREVTWAVAHTHNPATVWTSDSTGHWHTCPDCTEKVDFAAHISDNGTVTKPATETEEGVRTYKCTVCGYVMRTETIPVKKPDYYPNYNTYTPSVSVTPSYNFEQIKLTGKISKNNVILEWADVEDADKYTVYQLIDGKYKAIKTTAENTYTVENLPTGKYKFIVRYTVDGRISPISKCNSLNVNIKNSKPYPVATVKNNVVTLKWQPVDNAEKYAIYLVKDGKAAKLKETEKRAAAYVLESGKEYQFAVSAYVDGKWTTMKTSDIVKVTAEE